MLIFDPNEKTDYLAYAAVATSWDSYHKDHTNTKPLKDITLAALQRRRLGEGTTIRRYGSVNARNFMIIQ